MAPLGSRPRRGRFPKRGRRRRHSLVWCLVDLVREDATKGAGETMSIQSGPGGGGPDPGLGAVMGERRQLINVAYRLLGSLAEAEDAVQETYARWYAMTPQQQQGIESPGGWLTTVTSRICLDLLGSARARRERYVGDWLPEPLPDHTEWVAEPPGAVATASITQPGITTPKFHTTKTIRYGHW